MEEEKKKRKNKKKKNKQNKTTENVSSSAGELVRHDQNHVAESQEDTTETDTGEVQNNDAAKIDIYPNRDVSSNHPNLAEGDKQYWVDREAIYEEKIKQLEKENEAQVQKEAILEENIRQLLGEKSETLHRESKVEERLRQLENETIMHIHKGASLEEKVLQLQKEKDVLLQQVAVLDIQISQLQNEKDSWLQKEAGYEGKISLLVDEAATLNLRSMRYEEKIKLIEEGREMWTQKDNLMERTISSLNADNAFLQTQVKELEELRHSSVLENQLLKETVTTLQSQIHSFEKSTTPHSSTWRKPHTFENGDVGSETEVIRAMVEKLIAENSKLVEKADEHQRRGSTTEVSSSSRFLPMTGNAESTYNTNSEITSAEDPVIKPTEKLPVSKDTIQSTGDVHDEAKMNSLDEASSEDDSTDLDSSKIESSEIVQIPLDKNPEISSTHHYPEAVPLTDAPLIGAPFRLISFVARYVSGADLVDKNSAR